MSSFEHSVDVARGPREVWGVVGDFGNDELWRHVEQMRPDPPGPARVGTTTHEVLSFLGSTYVTDATVTAVEPGRYLAYEGGGDGTTVRGYRRVEEVPGGARFVEGLQVEMSGPMRLLEPLFARLYARRIDSETRALKMLLER